MFEIVGGVLSIVIGIVMLLIGSSIISQITGSGSIGDCSTLADGPAKKACTQTVNSGYTVIQIMSVMLIVGGVLISIRGYF